jgi:PIN domain nuclease of toxin-antitoxin system
VARLVPASAAHPIADLRGIFAGRVTPPDPFDRILAQATAEAMTLIGSDPIFGRCGLDVLWN